MITYTIIINVLRIYIVSKDKKKTFIKYNSAWIYGMKKIKEEKKNIIA